MIKLRRLEEKDAQGMLEWMHNPDIQKCFKKNMMDTTYEQALHFCQTASIPERPIHGSSVHYAIADDCTDEYLGTISLKDIDLENGSAEYAISTRKHIHGKGIAKKATGLLLEKAFFEFGLHRVYLNVLSNNVAAIRLYEKCGFVFEGQFRQHFRQGSEFVDWKWYGMLQTEFNPELFK